MALTFTDATVNAIASATPANGAASTSAEIDRGENTLIDSAMVEIHATASSSMSGTVTFYLYPMSGSSGTVYDDNAAISRQVTITGTTADLYFPLDPKVFGARYYKVSLLNSSGQNMTDLDVDIKMVKVTA